MKLLAGAGAVRFSTVLLLGRLAIAAPFDDPPKPDEPAPAFKFTAIADAMGTWNANSPASGLNQLHNFDINADAWSLASAALSIEHEGARFNFHVDAGFGDLNRTMVASDPWHGPNQYVQQAFVGFKPFADKPLKIEAGKFFTPAGGEVPETYNNFNTSRSLLFVLGIPYYNFGVRAIGPVTKEWSVAGYVVNGWSDVVDNNRGKTIGATATWTGKSQTFNFVYFGGPEKPDTTLSNRNLVDVVYGFTAKSWWNNYTEVLWAGEGRSSAGLVVPGQDVWYGVAHSTRFNVSKNWSLSPRLSWFMDRNGAASGLPQRLMEMTGTVEYRINKWMMARAEVRRDLSNRQFFDSNNHPASSKTQDTALVGMTFLWKAAR